MHMKALFLTVVLTAALFIAALKYWHISSTEMSEFCSRDRNRMKIQWTWDSEVIDLTVQKKGGL